MNPTTSVPSRRQLILVPAVITLAITALRLALELLGGPKFLANDAAGGAGALIGIVWLPLFFGPWFAAKLRPHVATQKELYKRLAGTLFAYGLAARVPIVVITVLAYLGQWGTHYEKFPFDVTFGSMLGATLFAQLVFWAGIWTVGVGMLAAWIVAKVQRPKGSELRNASALPNNDTA